MKKAWSAYAAGLAAALALGVWAAVLGAWAAVCALAGAGLFAAWWTAYFLRLGYACENGALFIRSGIFFVRQHAVPLDEINALTRVVLHITGRLSLPLLCVVRTAGGRFVIFAEFSTGC